MINTVKAIVDYLPADAFDVSPPPTPFVVDSLGGESSAVLRTNAQESARNNIIPEIVETERKYVQDLEVMQVSLHISSRLHL